MATQVGHVHVDHADILASVTNPVGFYRTDVCKRISLVPFASSISTGMYLSPNASHGLRETLNRGYEVIKIPNDILMYCSMDKSLHGAHSMIVYLMRI